jgi:hypothetical protein
MRWRRCFPGFLRRGLTLFGLTSGVGGGGGAAILLQENGAALLQENGADILL